MKPAVLGVALATSLACVACGAAPGGGIQGRPSTTRDTSWRDPTVDRTENAAPTRDPDRSRGADKSDKSGKGR